MRYDFSSRLLGPNVPVSQSSLSDPYSCAIIVFILLSEPSIVEASVAELVMAPYPARTGRSRFDSWLRQYFPQHPFYFQQFGGKENAFGYIPQVIKKG